MPSTSYFWTITYNANNSIVTVIFSGISSLVQYQILKNMKMNPRMLSILHLSMQVENKHRNADAPPCPLCHASCLCQSTDNY